VVIEQHLCHQKNKTIGYTNTQILSTTSMFEDALILGSEMMILYAEIDCFLNVVYKVSVCCKNKEKHDAGVSFVCSRVRA
jgi:hypothetical protein